MLKEYDEKYLPVFQDLAKFFCCDMQEMQIAGEYNEGNSGDVVLLIRVLNANKPAENGEYVLKIFSNQSDDFPDEIINTHEVYEQTPKGSIVIPKLRHFGKKPAFYLYDVAGDAFLGATSMSNLQPYQLKVQLESLSDALLFEWNKDFRQKEASIHQLLIDWLKAERLTTGSRLCQRVQAQIEDEWIVSFIFNQKQYPNPLFYLANKESILNSEDAMVLALYGQIHGDLNLDNVIVQSVPRSHQRQFYLIDFEQYQSDAPLFFDHAYLLFCVLLEATAACTMQEWCKIIEDMFNNLLFDAVLPSKNEEPYTYIQSHKEALQHFLMQQQAHNKKSVCCQIAAAHIAVGLNFLNKRTSDDRRQKMSLLYAAIALQSLFKILGYSAQEQPYAPSLQGLQVEEAGLWHTLEHFSADNRYILLTSGKEDDVSADVLSNLAPVGWTMVIEVNGLIDNSVRNKVLAVYKRVLGYRFFDIPNLQDCTYEAAPTWVHIEIPELQKNPQLYYSRQIQSPFQKMVKSVFSLCENEPLFILTDSSINPKICHAILQDILVQAGENTPIHILGLGGFEPTFDTDANLQCYSFKSNLAALARSVYQLRGYASDVSEIRLPGKDGSHVLAPELVANLQNDVILIHRGIIHGLKDDNGDGFFHGNEASWLDIARGRDVLRLDYQRKWRTWLDLKMEQVTMGSSIVVHLRHRPGGGGTTLAKRIAWDFCVRYPVIFLQKISNQTAERLKVLYQETKLPILVIAEISDGAITQEGISILRRDLISKNARSLFLCVSRFSGKRAENYSENVLYLPAGASFCMTSEEAEQMLACFSNRLKGTNNSNLSDECMETRIQQLNLLTYNPDNIDIRQPFFYGLYAYENDFQGVKQYVKNNSANLNKEESITLDILALLTAYSQSANLSFAEAALFLFPDASKQAGAQIRLMESDVKEWMYANPLIVRRERGVRICHPVIAEEILQLHGLLKKGNEYDDVLRGTDAFVELVQMFVDVLTDHFGSESFRINNLFHEIFTHRDVVTEGEQKKFSDLLTAIYSKERCVKVMEHIAGVMPHNPHYKNHLARLYLYPVTDEQTTMPQPETAIKYANQAIDCAAQNGSNISIHYHVLGKAYTKQCTMLLRKSIRPRKKLRVALKSSRTAYLSACNAFDKCIALDKTGYGLTGKLELITSVLSSIGKNMHTTISNVLSMNSDSSNEISQMISEAGNLIGDYAMRFENDSDAFRNACLQFYKTTGNHERLELLFKANASTEQSRTHCNRAISAVLIGEGFKKNTGFSYNNLKETTLRRIHKLMQQNIDMMTDDEMDRMRWIETYRRLPDFSVINAYHFLLNWPHGNDNLFVCYYRYVLAFILYDAMGEICASDVQKHLEQTLALSRNAYGKNTTTSLDYFGLTGSNECDLLIPRVHFGDGIKKEARVEQNIQYRTAHCKKFKGTVESIDDGMLSIRFRCGQDYKSFLAKTPNIYKVLPSDEGKTVDFCLGFSYSGLRAWDVSLIED